MSESPNRRDDRSLATLDERVGAFRGLYDRIILSWQLFWDKRVGLLPKLIPIFALIYVISPIDLLPALALGPLGMVDDASVVALMLALFAEVVPHDIVEEHMRRIRGGSQGSSYSDDDVIDGEVIEE
ncbi:MAG: DUF1232 domain-containing protein [Chloroflexota bacterium]|jgi:uncharacterized membrane protein YkvA (DUF1232 family)